MCLATVPENSPYTPAYRRQVAIEMYKRLKALFNYKPTFEKLNCNIALYRPKLASIQNIAEDYNLSVLTRGVVDVKFFEGNHMTILESLLVVDAIMQELGDRELQITEKSEHFEDDLLEENMCILNNGYNGDNFL